jgi:hypothetical protein
MVGRDGRPFGRKVLCPNFPTVVVGRKLSFQAERPVGSWFPGMCDRCMSDYIFSMGIHIFVGSKYSSV